MRIAHLYPDLLNLYGDRGNIMCLQYRCRQRGIQVTVDEISVGDPFDHTKYDLLFIGGGQDFEQEVLLEDLHRGKDEEIRRAVADGTVVLAICGGYQMLGKYYQTYTGERLDYIGAVDFYTVGEKERLIGNYAFDTEFGRVIGFENHSGRPWARWCPATATTAGTAPRACTIKTHFAPILTVRCCPRTRLWQTSSLRRPCAVGIPALP